MLPTLITAWSDKRQESRVIAEHSHNYHELVFYRHGSGRGNVGDVPYSFRKGDLLLLPPNIPHSEYHESAGEVICVCFTADNSPQSVLLHDSEGVLLPLLNALLSEMREQKHGYREMLSYQLGALLLLVERLHGNTTNSHVRNFGFAIAYLDGNYHENIRLSELAARMNISYDYFRHRFVALTGLSPQQYLINKRLRAAAELLSTTSLSCTEIALRCGFASSAQFSMLFHREYGLSPKIFQKKNNHFRMLP